MVVVVTAVAVPIEMSPADRTELERRIRAGTTPQRQVLRALIVVLAADGASNAQIAADLGICVDTARKWRGRFAADGLAGLVDAPRSGRPPVYTGAERAQVTAWACALPAEHGVPLSRWSTAELARHLFADHIAVSVSTVRRWLADDALKPWQHQSWIFVRDPQFEAKAAVVLELYARTYRGVALGADEYVICADEKPSIQARDRCHATAPAGPADAHQSRLPPQRCAGLSRSVRRAPCSRVRAVRIFHRHRAVHRAGRSGHDGRTVRLGPACLLDRR